MQRIFIDVTNISTVKFISGIQRVVKNVILEIYKYIPNSLNFIYYSSACNRYELVDRNSFVDFLNLNQRNNLKYYKFSFSNFHSGDIFFDLDAVWNNSYSRNVLYPSLKDRGIRIAVYVYDIVPVTNPQFTHPNTVINFLNYFSATLSYADLIISSTQATIDAINNLTDCLSMKRINSSVSWLGSDFISDFTNYYSSIPEDLKKITKNKYILSVGTIEPRKNHSYLMDAFEKKLFSKGLFLVFAGRKGWNIDKFISRMNKSRYRGKQFFWFDSLDDNSINYLYEHAYLVANPTYNEGFGLPVVEALQKGVPVIASDIPVMREVGKDFCRYFDIEKTESFIELVDDFLANPDEYALFRKKVSEFKSFTWDETAQNIITSLGSLKPKERSVKNSLKQMVILSAREDVIGETLKFIDVFMPFISEIVLLCPANKQECMLNCYSGRLAISAITDDDLLQDRDLPQDHGARNFLLRCLSMRRSEIDDVFLMSDDDYRPLRHIDLTQFINDGKYRSYYFYDMRDWKGTVGHMTSYDQQHFNTLNFLKNNNLPTLQYSSHMPQIIDKEIYNEFLDKYTGVENLGIDEWSSYFNYAQYTYPSQFKLEPYVTLAWPANHSDFEISVIPQEFVFENFYHNLYDDNCHFAGLNVNISDSIYEENKFKCNIYKNIFEHERDLKNFKHFTFESYARKYRNELSFLLHITEDKKSLVGPEELFLPLGFGFWFPFHVFVNIPNVTFNYSIILPNNNTLVSSNWQSLPKNDLSKVDNKFNFYIFPISKTIDVLPTIFSFSVSCDGLILNWKCPLVYVTI